MVERPLNSQRGFTLIEIIVVMVLMGIIAIFSSLFIVSGVSSYVTAVGNTETVQRARLAMGRIAVELETELVAIESFSTGESSNAAIEYLYQTDPNPKRYRHIALVGTGTRKAIVLIETTVTPSTPNPSDDEVLVDNVSTFTLGFKKFDDTDWATTDDIGLLAKIEITLSLFINDSDDDKVEFTTTLWRSQYDDVITMRMPAHSVAGWCTHGCIYSSPHERKKQGV